MPDPKAPTTPTSITLRVDDGKLQNMDILQTIDITESIKATETTPEQEEKARVKAHELLNWFGVLEKLE